MGEPGGSGRRGVAALGLIAGVLIALSAATAAPAAASERMIDGGFEGATCSSVDCTSPVWKETVNSGSGVGLLCATTIQPCDDNGTPAIGQRWVLWHTSGQLDASVSQAGIVIPARPARLTFLERPGTGNGPTGTFTVQIDGSTVYEESNVASAFYERKTVNLDQFAGSGTHALTFHAALTSPIGPDASWNMDDVSLDAPDAPAAHKKCKKGFRLKKVKTKSGKVKKKCVHKRKRR